MIPPEFEYSKATSIQDAIAQLAANEDAKLLAPLGSDAGKKRRERVVVVL